MFCSVLTNNYIGHLIYTVRPWAQMKKGITITYSEAIKENVFEEKKLKKSYLQFFFSHFFPNTLLPFLSVGHCVE